MLDDDRGLSAAAAYLKNSAVRANKRFQHVTIFEHVRRRCCAGSVEVGQIQVHQILAAIKHLRHIHYLGSIETGQIQIGQATAAGKHIGHVRHIGCIKTIPEIDCFQVDKPPKHIGGIRIRSNLPVGGYIQIVAAHPSKNASVSRV